MEKFEQIDDIKRVIIDLENLEKGLNYAREIGYADIVINIKPYRLEPPLYKKKFST